MDGKPRPPILFDGPIEAPADGGFQTMKMTYDDIEATNIWRNDRFWIAGDHVVEPRVMSRPNVQAMVATAEKAKRDFKMTEYQGMNYTIMHTEFARERAQPGMLVIGSDSHTCSSGAVGCLAIGLGAADVVMPLVTGETWFKIPETILIRFIGQPTFGMTGKDVILYILKELKRNTVAASRIVEFAGPGTKWLSFDARFAICNMCTVRGTDHTSGRVYLTFFLGVWRHHGRIRSGRPDQGIH